MNKPIPITHCRLNRLVFFDKLNWRFGLCFVTEKYRTKLFKSSCCLSTYPSFSVQILNNIIENYILSTIHISWNLRSLELYVYSTGRRSMIHAQQSAFAGASTNRISTCRTFAESANALSATAISSICKCSCGYICNRIVSVRSDFLLVCTGLQAGDMLCLVMRLLTIVC